MVRRHIRLFLLSRPLETNNLLISCALLSVFGTATTLLGGMWDASSHALEAPEVFWSIQHVAVYSGVAMIGSASVIGSILIVFKKMGSSKKRQRFVAIIIAGALLQIFGGYADSISHTVYGVDGLISPSHQTVETGLLLSALGGFLMLSQKELVPNLSYKLREMLSSLSALVFLGSGVWLAFNIAVLFGAQVVCIPVYHVFSSGCAVM